MSTEALPELQEAREPLPSNRRDAPEWREGAAGRRGSALQRTVKWASIAGLLTLGGLWSHVTPFEVVARFTVEAGAIVVMAQSLLARNWATLAVAAVLALLYNPLAPVFDLSGAWQRAVLVVGAVPFLVLLIWRDVRVKMTNDGIGSTAFREGDEVVLDRGSYQGTPGVFVGFLKDVNWANIRERDGNLRSHPVAWLAHAPDTVPTGAN